ncbi:isocitrate lyase/phosphoenolpyruvate mutase family protein [Fulvivirgaceae bacterium BMA10]|uniref:Isocitrate lyase/phosphoenolpyruvate mutase family protein n=1 Tax=Splendidivirga corallicola TaxID=3051826 RepID=A0ABT8KPX4_9BACT|nr:isocitrate lyase/phosphoenolpyruvate mutase family protein [Fulvivirgaceae bacterium BMA10]
MKDIQRKKAETLLELHHSDKLLILPNIWDVLGAKLLESEGFEAIATASASVAFSRGYDDNQEIDFTILLRLLRTICNSTSLPVTADIERGYAGTLDELTENIKNLINCGIVGLNIEDSNVKGQDLEPIDLQCEKIKLIRKVSDDVGVPLVINARTDVFLIKHFEGNRLKEAIRRGRQYMEAGADCFYPILCGNDELKEINLNVQLPVNVIAQQHTFSIKELEQLKIARLSFGPALLKSVLMKMQEIFQSIKQDVGFNSFINENMISSARILEIIKS